MVTKISDITLDDFYVDDISHTLYGHEYFGDDINLRLKTFLDKSYDVTWQSVKANSEPEVRQKALESFCRTGFTDF